MVVPTDLDHYSRSIYIPGSDGIETVLCVACDQFKDIFGVHSTHISFTFIGRSVIYSRRIFIFDYSCGQSRPHWFYSQQIC